MNVAGAAPKAAEAECNNCGSAAHAVLYRAGEAQLNQVVRCTDCGLMYAHPRARNLDTYLHGEDVGAPLTAESPQVKHTADKLPDYRNIIGRLESMLPDKGRLVEVGSYSGCLTDLFRKAGWQVTAIEPDGRAARYARETYGVEVHQGTLDTAELPPGGADAVVMLHVIEHVDDPRQALRTVRASLREGGVFALETPSYDGLSFKLLGRRERSLSCDGHIYFYTVETLTALLRQTGFVVERVEKVGRTMSVGRLLWNLGVISKSKGLQRALDRLSKRLGLERRYLYLNLRDMVRIYARATNVAAGAAVSKS